MAHIPSINFLDKVLTSPGDTPCDEGLPWELHAACAAWPEMMPLDLRDLASDIAAHGLRDPITLTADNLLLDGRNRALACVIAGVEPRTTIYEGDPWLFSLSRNKHRRHMSQDQIAMVVAELVTMKPLGANQHEGGPIGLPSIAKAAENAGITVTALKSAKVLYKHGTPEEVRAVKSGNAPLYKKADDVRKRRRALTPPAPPKPKSVQAQPAADPIDDVACDIIGKASDGVWRALPKIASIVGVAARAAREGLKRLGPDCVELGGAQMALSIGSSQARAKIRATPISRTSSPPRTPRSPISNPGWSRKTPRSTD